MEAAFNNYKRMFCDKVMQTFALVHFVQQTSRHRLALSGYAPLNARFMKWMLGMNEAIQYFNIIEHAVKNQRKL